jgi:RNA polymerase sigma-70 factor (ECF subfamily)
MHLTDSRLRRFLDSADVCQSVLANFFVRVAAGQFELDSPEQLVRLLATMSRNRLRNHAEQQQARRRDQRRLRVDADKMLAVAADREPTPSRIVAGRELLERVRQQLQADEQALAERRVLGRTWEEIAGELGGTPEGRRKQLARALDRVMRELGLEEEGLA